MFLPFSEVLYETHHAFDQIDVKNDCIKLYCQCKRAREKIKSTAKMYCSDSVHGLRRNEHVIEVDKYTYEHSAIDLGQTEVRRQAGAKD